ncbi:MAG: hypothetical protein JSW49_08070 [candidate division WOR-3 bacterium]|nr:MAG: hypothetical protein JSW49_08070 [candidate division WOR-3 bacterium]
MDIEGFRQFLAARNVSEEAIKTSVGALQAFDKYLKSRSKDVDKITRTDFYEYSKHLIENERNTLENYLALLRYGYFKKLDELIVAGMEVLDGREVIDNLSRRLTSEFTQELRDDIFGGMEIPPLGISPQEKPVYTRMLIERLEKKIGTAECAKFLNQGLRDRYEEARKPDREKFLKSKNIDEFLKQKHEDFVTELNGHYEKGTLFFTQAITKDVLEHVRNDPYIESGVREGDKIIIEKIPHMAKEYLAEKDEDKRRYYYCHCPWVKEAFKESPAPISPVFCNCSAGFYRAYWEIVFDEPVRVDVLESLLKGDSICKFAVHIPTPSGDGA